VQATAVSPMFVFCQVSVGDFWLARGQDRGRGDAGGWGWGWDEMIERQTDGWEIEWWHQVPFFLRFMILALALALEGQSR